MLQKCILLYSQKYGGMKLDQARKETGDLSSIHWKTLVYVNRTCVTHRSKLYSLCLLILMKKNTSD